MKLRDAPPGTASVPPYDNGWAGEPFLSYATPDDVNWSDDLEDAHEESSRTHFLDVWTRAALLEQVAGGREDATIVDLGCSTGYLLEDLRTAHPAATLVGIDLIAGGLRKAHRLVPSARLLQADACELPLEDESVDAVLSANLLEHIHDDRRALAEAARILRPGATCAFVVPAGPSTYDYYDKYLGHERRYVRGELAAKVREAGLRVTRDSHIASLLYPPFWLVKQRNRRLFGHLEGEALAARVARDIRATNDSAVGRFVSRIERALPVGLPFGIRSLVVAHKEPS